MKKLFPLILGALLCSPAQAVTVSIQMWIPAYCMYATGSIYATAEGGTEPYTYSWNTGSTDPSLYDLVAGTYSVTVTDANSDQATANITLTSYPFEAAVEGMVGCPDDMIGPPFRMIGQSDIYVTGVPPLTLDGNYLADVITGGPGGLAALYVSNFNVWPAAGTQLSIPFTDSNGCPGTIVGVIPQPPEYPVVQVLTTEPACAGGSNGTAMVQVAVAPNLDPYHIRLIKDGAPYGFLEDQYTVDQMYGQIPHTTLRQSLPPGEYGMAVGPRFEDPFEWLDPYFTFVENFCADTSWFTIDEMPGPCGTLKGTVYMDDNQDCIMAGLETRVPNEVMVIEPGGYTAMTGSTGYYQINLPTGSYTIDQASAVLDEHCIGVPIPFNLGNDGQTITQNMGDTVLVPRDVELFMGSGLARPGFNHDLYIHVHHETLGGTGALTVSCTFDPALSFTSASPTPSNVNGNTLTWTLSQLTSFGNRHISINLQVPPNPGLIGTDLMHSASVGIVQPETNLTNNSAFHTRTVTASFDPNDKIATTSSQGSDALYFIDQDEWIDYTIRFQNTGTDTAFTVVITDTLPQTLDPATLEMGPRSHNCIAQMAGQGIMRFIFTNIQLPDSSMNEPASHGLVQFRIRPHLPVGAGSVIENTANIYFDFNDPVITEPSMLVAEFSTSVLPNSYVTGLEVFPNPTNGSFTVRSPHSSIRSVQLLSADGRLIMQEQSAGGASIMIDATSLAPGTYIVVTTSGTGARSRTRLTKN